MIKIQTIDFENDSEIQLVARIHEEMPSLWNEDYTLSAGDHAELTQKIASRSGSEEHLYLVAKDGQGTIVGMEWGALKEVYGQKVVNISSIWVDEKVSGNIARSLNIRIEEWASQHNAESILIDVHSNNKRMMKLARYFGFIPGFVAMEKKL